MNDLNNSLIAEVKTILETARQNVARQVNSELLTAYWNIGRIIVEHEQKSNKRAEYGTQMLKELSKALTAEFGKGFSRSNLQNMRLFYMNYQICQTLSGKLSWSHYCELHCNGNKFFTNQFIYNLGWSFIGSFCFGK